MKLCYNVGNAIVNVKVRGRPRCEESDGPSLPALGSDAYGSESVYLITHHSFVFYCIKCNNSGIINV